MTLLVCYPSSLLKPGRVDEQWEEEASHTALPLLTYSSEEERLWRKGQEVEGAGVLYRGWILTPEAYRCLSTTVEAQGGHLLVSPAAYEAAQYASGWLPFFQDLTFPSLLLPHSLPPQEVAGRAGKELGREGAFVVKGESKSLKHLWATHMFAPTLEALPAVVEAFQEEVTAAEEPHLLVRRFEEVSEWEARTWWVDGHCTLVEQHPQNQGTAPKGGVPQAFLQEVEAAVARLACPLVTVDVAQLATGSWRVVEVGCGEVSEARSGFSQVVVGTRLAG